MATQIARSCKRRKTTYQGLDSPHQALGQTQRGQLAWYKAMEEIGEMISNQEIWRVGCASESLEKW